MPVEVILLVERENGSPTVVFRGRVLSVRVDPVIAKSGPTTREVVERPNAVAVIAEDDKGSVVVIQQFRWAVQTLLYELPAGLVEPGESALQAAQRELAEETGYVARQWEAVYDCFTTPGYSSERIALFYAHDLALGRPHGDADEEIAVKLWTPLQVRQYLRQTTTHNGVFVLGVLWWLQHNTL